MNNNLFNPETIGSYSNWWTGIIVSDESWKGNQKSEKWSSIDDLPGWGARYKVRIVGKHTQERGKLADDRLELCEVLYPVTAGTGHAASYQTSNLRQGSVVFGIYKDGDGNEPLIIGCIGNNSQTYLNSSQKNGFDTLRGFNLSAAVPIYAVVPGGSPPEPGPEPNSLLAVGTGDPNVTYGDVKIETNDLNSAVRITLADQIEAIDQAQSSYVATTSTCEPIQLTGIAKSIQNLIQDIEKVKQEVNSWKYRLTNELISEDGQKFGLQEYIQYKVQNVSKEITGWFKGLIGEIEKRVKDNIERGAKDLYYLLFPNARPKAKAAVETALDLASCLFRKIIGQLISILTKFLLDAVDRFINVPLCAAENILAAVIGKLTGLINSALSAIMAPVNAILGAVDLVGDILSIVQDILSFLSCDERPQCSEIKEWSIYDGPGPGLTLDIGGLFNKVKTFASNVSQSVDPDNFDFDLDFSDVFSDTCNVGPIFCGPPTVEFFGGGGSGASGNAIVSAAGEILGVDITTTGSGYTSQPIVRFVDGCGKGRGAVGRAVLGRRNTVDGTPLTETTTSPPGTDGNTDGVVAVIMNETGTGYLPSPNGDLGGDGRVWADKNKTTVKRDDGTYDRPYDPGEDIDLSPGDSVRTPDGTTLDLNGETIIGGDYRTVNTKGKITAPKRQVTDTDGGKYPGLNNGSYPVILYLCGLEIGNAGFNYSSTDRIVIEPSNGASAIPTFGAFGTLEKVEITSQGEGFTDTPNIYIESETGYNAKLIPRFCIDRVSTDQIKEPEIGKKIISVVDCVGKVPQVNFFRVPQ
jgi:hypothetical protein